MSGNSTVSMYSRRTCGLCEKAKAVIMAEQAHTRFGFDEIFIDGDDVLELEYGLRVPVVLVDGEEAFDLFVDPVRLRALLRP